METDFAAPMKKTMLIAMAFVVPPGLLLCGLLGKGKGLAGAAVGFAVAAAYTFFVVYSTQWALKKPVNMLPTILMLSYLLRIIALAAILWGLHYIDALNMIALLGCFLALFITESAVEVFYVYRSFGVLTKKPEDEGEQS